MGLDALLATLERREAVTPVTPRYPPGVTAKAAPDKACTPVTPVTPINDEGEIRAGDGTADAASAARRWRVCLPNRDPVEVIFAAEATRAQVADLYPGARIEPMTEPSRAAATPAEAARLRVMIGAVLADESDDDRAEALAVALADVDAALVCYRALTSAGSDPRMCRCLDCAGYSVTTGKCLQAARGASFGYGMAVSRRYAPPPLQASRCAAFLPLSDDPDRRTGAERWPFLMSKGGK